MAGKRKEQIEKIDITEIEKNDLPEVEKQEESPSDKVEIIRAGVTRIRTRAEAPAYIAQGWKLK